MNKSAIEKVLLQGTPKQRALLLANHLSEVNLGGKGFLSDSEFTSLTSSFESESELKVYNLYNRRFRLVGTFLTNLSQARLSYKEALERLEKYLLLRMNNDDFEDAINTLLNLMLDKQTKDKGLKLLKSFNRLPLYRWIKPDDSGLIRIEENRLSEIIDQLRERVRQEQISLKTSIQALKDYLDHTGFNVKVFKAFLKEVENWAKSEKGMTLLFSESLERGPKGLDLDTSRAKELKRLRNKYTLEMDYEEVQIDQDFYDRIRRDELDA